MKIIRCENCPRTARAETVLYGENVEVFHHFLTNDHETAEITRKHWNSPTGPSLGRKNRRYAEEYVLNS